MEIEQPINDKVKEYCHYCVCKSCEDVQRLQAENAKLNAIIDSYQPKIQALKDENERLKEEIKQLEDFIKSDSEIDHINHEYTYKLKQTLQNIKEIAKDNIIGCFSNKCDLADEILQKITKAEE